MPRFAPHHIHLMSHDAMAAGAFYERMFGAEIEASKGANGLPRANLKLGDQVILISTVRYWGSLELGSFESFLGLSLVLLASLALTAPLASVIRIATTEPMKYALVAPVKSE